MRLRSLGGRLPGEAGHLGERSAFAVAVRATVAHEDECAAGAAQHDAQAALINRALAVSPIYSRIVEVAKSGIIDRQTLENTPADQQVGAVPHGIPITGIGACSVGQSLCTLNPAISCYTCRKFMPINEADVHRQVLADLRKVVQLFYNEARGERGVPAFLQLRVTLEAIEALIGQLSQPATDRGGLGATV